MRVILGELFILLNLPGSAAVQAEPGGEGGAQVSTHSHAPKTRNSDKPEILYPKPGMRGQNDILVGGAEGLKPKTMTPKPETRDSKPENRNSKPDTINSKPETRHANPGGLRRPVW